MKIVIISPYNAVIPHFETELEIAQTHLDRGHQVTWVYCTGELANCDFNNSHDQRECISCTRRRQNGIRLLDRRIKISDFGADRAYVDIQPQLKTSFDSIDELRNYQVGNFDIGYAALSSLVSSCRDPQPNLNDYADRLTKFLLSSFQTYHRTLEFLKKNMPDRVYVFNGRFAAMRAVLRACQEFEIDCFIHERGCDNNHYQLFENHLPHDVVEMQKRMRLHWEQAESTSDERKSVARQWFLDRANRVEKGWKSFVKGQDTDRLPANWSLAKQNISIFCSSEDEFASIGDCWQNPIYKTQVEGIQQIVDEFKNDPTFHFYLRIHPNLTNVDNASTNELKNIKASNLTVIQADEPIDTYALIRASDKVITFGSTVGLEATFWERPSILLGACYYRGLGSTYEPSSHQEATELIRQTLETKDLNSGLMYAYWFATNGIPYRYYQATDFFDGLYRGNAILAEKHPSRLRRSVRKIERLVKRVKSLANF